MHWYSSYHGSATSLFFHTPVQKNYSASLVTACLKTNLNYFGFTVQL